MSFVQNILWNSVEGFVEAGTRTAGQYAGDALIKAGDMIENSGRSVGNGIERRASAYASTISGQQSQASGKALPSTARKPVMKRSNSSPAVTGPGKGTRAIGPASKTPVGAKKNPAGGAGAAKQVTGGVNKTVGGTQKSVGGVAGGVGKTVGGMTSGAQKSIGGVTGAAGKAVGGVTGGAQKNLSGATGAAKSTTKSTAALPKPYPNNQPYGISTKPSQNTKAGGGKLSGPYNGSSYPGAEKKSAVKPGQPKPFKAPADNKGGDEKKGYPGQGSRVPVQNQKHKPLERMQGTAERGKAQHISV